MARRRKGDVAGAPARADAPAEIPMTDLEYQKEQEARSRGVGGDSHAAGTPGGGTALGGLAGTNVDDGSPDDVDLEDAMGSGVHDQAGEEDDEPAHGGPSGGAVGGTPANRRARGGRTHHGLNPGDTPPGDSTIGRRP